MDRSAGSGSPEAVSFDVAEADQIDAAGSAELRVPSRREIIEVRVDRNNLDELTAFVREHGAKASFTSDGGLGLRFPDGGLIVLSGTSGLAQQIGLSEGRILAILNNGADPLIAFLDQLKDGLSQLELSAGSFGGDARWDHAVRNDPQILGQSSAKVFDTTVKAGLGSSLESLGGVLYETARWGRDDLKRGEAGERGQFVKTATGEAIPHLVGLGDEEIGRRNGEKIVSSDNAVFAGVDTSVGSGIDHLWLLGDFEFHRASRDLEEGEDVFAAGSDNPTIWTPLEPLTSFVAIEDTPYSGQLFDPADVRLPVTERSVKMDPRFGTVTLGPDGRFDYKPANGFSGTATFTYQFKDPRTGETVSGKVTFIVEAVADPATISGSASTPEDVAVATPVDIDLNDPDGSEDIEQVVIAGLPSGAALNWNTALPGSITVQPDGSFLVKGSTAEIQALMQSLSVTPPHDFHGEITLDIAVTTIERNVPRSLPGYLDRETVHYDYHIHVEAVADNVTATGDDETTDEDTLVHLDDLAATFGDSLDGSETHVVEIRGVDADAKLTNSAGVEYPFTIAGDGTKTYTFTPGQVGSIYFLPPKDESGTFAGMTIVAIATEGSNNDQEIATAPIRVVVNPVADPLEITAPQQATDEDTPVTFGDDIDIVVRDPATQDIIEVVVSGFPAGTIVTYTPVGGGPLVTLTMPAGGSVTLNGGSELDIRAALATLTLTPPPHTDQNITLSVSATTEDLGGVTDTQTVPMIITVAAVADGPTLSGAADGNEDSPINLPIASTRIDADGSESYEFASITPPAGVTLIYGPVLPNGITVSVVSGVHTFTPGPTTTAAQFESFLATGLKVQAPADSDENFDVTVKVGTIESVLSGGEVSLLRADQTIVVPVTVHPVVDMPTVSGASTVDEDTSVSFGADIGITENDKSDGSEAITQIVLGNIPVGATVTYTPVGGVSVTVNTVAGVKSYTVTGGSEDDIRDTIATFTLQPPLHSDVNIPVSVAITKVDQTTSEGEAAATQTATLTHNITVKAVADGPTLSGAASGNEDQPIDLPITSARIDADGSEQYDFASITPPAGVTLIYGPVLPNGITVSVNLGTYTFTPGPTTTAAQFESFLATGLKVQAPADSDVNFDVSVKVGTIESVLSDTGLTLLKKDLTVTVPVTVHPVIDAPVISGSSTVNEDGIVNAADQTVTAGVNFGANVAITAPDSSDGSEAITQIVVSGLPIGAVVTYTPVGGSSTTFTVGAGTTSITLNGGSEAAIRAALATLTLTPPSHSDADIPLGIAVTKVDQTTTEGEAAVSQIFNGTHTIKVAAIADVPTLSGSGAGYEDQNIPVSITAGHPDNADGSETLKNVVISGVPAGFTLSESSSGAGVLTANGGGTYTVTGPNDAAINDVLANLSLVFASGGVRQHLDSDFNLSVTVTTIESSPTETGSGQMTQLETAKTFNVPVTVTAVVDGVTKSGSSVIVEDVAKSIGSDIAYAKIDADGSENVTSVVVSGFPVGSTVSYTDMLGASHSFVAVGGETITLSGSKSAATETAIRTALDTLNVTAPANSDVNFSLNVAVTTTDNDSSATTQNFTHAVVVQAVADTPAVAADDISLNEDATTTLVIRPDSSSDNGAADNSETLSVRITVPSDGTGVIGTLSGTAPGGVTFTNVGGGVYTVTATGADPAAREALLDGFLNGGITFTPRAQWSGLLTGTNGIKVEAISTEAASGVGVEVAPNSYGGADNTSQTETITTYIDVNVAAVPDTPVLAFPDTIVQENNNQSDPADNDLIVPIGTRLGLTIADTDGSETLSLTLTGFPLNAQALAFGTSHASVTTNVDSGTGTVTLSGPANQVLTVLNSLSVTLADDRDQNFTVNVSGTSTDSNGVTPVSTPISLSHTVTVQAVADTPTVNVGAATKPAVDEDSGFVTYSVTTGLNDTDGSETYQSVVIQFSTPGAGNPPVLQFGTSTGVNIVAAAGQLTLTGAAADIDAAMATLQVKPGADNGEDITITVTATAVESNPAEDNNGGSPGMGGGVAGDEISVPTAQTVASFVIPVNPLSETPNLSVPASASGAEDTKFALGAITVSSGSTDPDGSETRFFEIDTTSYPTGTLFYNGAATVGTVVTPGWLRVTEAQLGSLSIQAPTHYSGTINLSVRGVIVDTTLSGTHTSVTTAQTLPVTVTPDADAITPPSQSSGVEDNGAIAVGADLASSTTGIRLVDNATGIGNNTATETLSQIKLDFPDDTATQTYTIVQGAVVGSAQIAFDSGTRTYTITSTIITGAADVGLLSQTDRNQAEADIRATLNGFTVTMGPTHTDLNGSVQVTATTLDVNGGLANTQDNSFAHSIRVQAVADTPSVSVVDPSAVIEDGANIALTINAGNSADSDNSETLSVRITIPSDGSGPVGTLVGTPPAGVTVTNQGGGVYLVTATGADNAAREGLIDSYLNGGAAAFDPRANWSGSLTGTSGIKVEVISTEAATGSELAANSFGGPDGTSKTETVTDYIDIVVTPVVDAPTVKGNGVGLEDTRIPIPMSVTLADKDGSETYVVRVTGGVPPGAQLYGAGGSQVIPDGLGVYTLTPADVAVLAIQPPLHYSSALSGNISLVTQTDVTDSGGGTMSFTNTIVVEVTGVADQPGTRTVNVSADEDEAIELGAAILASASGNLNNLLVDSDGSEALSFVVGGLPQGVIPTSTVPGGVTYIGNGTWSITAAAMPSLELPPVPNFSGTNPYSGVTVRAVTQEIDGDEETSPQWPVTITVNPVIAAGTVDGFASWSMGVTQSEGTNETGGDISLASVANHSYVDNDGSEAVISYTFDLSALLSNAGIAAQLEALDGTGADLDDLVANHISGTFTYNAGAGTITVAAANIAGVAIDGALFLDSNEDFSLPVTALVRDTATFGPTTVSVDKTEAGTFEVDLIGTADTPTVFASSASGNSGTLLPVTLGGDSTDTDVALGRTPLSEDIYYVVSLLNPGTAPALGFTDAMGNLVGLDNGDGTWILMAADLVGLHVTTPGGSTGTANLRLTTIATENDGDTASNSTTFNVVVTSAPGGGGTPPQPPEVDINTTAGNEDGSITLNVTAGPGTGDLSNPSVAVMISNLPAGAEVIGARYNPDTGRWVASAAAVNSDAVKIIPPPDFSGVMNITIEAVATNASLLKASTGQQTVPIDVDPVADGVAISATPDAGVEDVAIDLNISLAERDVDGNEVIGDYVYVTLTEGATLVGAYPVVTGTDTDASIDGVNLVGTIRVPAADVATLQALPAANWHGSFNVVVRSYSTEPADDADGDHIQLDTATFSIAVTADADAPTVAAPASVSGNEDTSLAIPGLAAALVDTVATNGAEVLSVKISGVPDGTRFSAGSNNGDGSWTIPLAALPTLSITPPLNYAGTMTLTLTAIALELDNGDEAQSSVNFDVIVAPKADTVEILAKNVAIDATASAALDLNVRMADDSGTTPGEAAPEQIRITFSSVPTGVSMVATAGGTFTNPVAGTWVFTGTEAESNAIAAIAGATATGGTYSVALSAVTIDGADTLAGAVTDSFQLTIPQVMAGTSGNNSITGSSGTQLLFGLGGNDTLNGGAGNDHLAGGTGNDTYVVDSAGDVVVEAAGEGTNDVVQTSLASYILGMDVEGLVFTGSGSFAGTGNAAANSLTGGTGNDTLDGGGGVDVMIGGAGNDTYVVDSAGETLTEGAGAGTDTVLTSLSSFTLATNFEHLTYTGSGSFAGTGNTVANVLTGGSDADILSGRGGADTLTGGAGADTFGYAAGDLGAGVDTVTDFTNGGGGDKLDISALLTGFNPGTSVLTDFVRVTEAAGNSTIRVDANGGGDSFQDLVILQGVTGLDVNTMRTNGNLIV